MPRETKPFKLDPKRDDGEVRYYYEDFEITADFDVSEELAAHEASYAARQGSGKSSAGLTARVRKLKSEVGQKGMTPAEAEKLDPEAFNECFSALEGLRKRYLAKPENQPKVGDGGVYRKGSLGIFGPTRAGKEVLADEISRRLTTLAALAGQDWVTVKPSGEHSAEDVGTAEIAHHEDVRWQFTRSYDDTLRYTDADQAPMQGARNSNLAGIAPRAIVMTTSETLGSLALSLKARKSSDELALTFDKYPAIDVDEFLFRLGWVVEVRKPAGIGLRDLARTKAEMIVSISRVEENPDARVEVISNRAGENVGRIRTKHRLDPVAIIKGCENAARFLAMSIIEEYSPDVAAAIPEALVAFASERRAIEQGIPLAHETRALEALAAQPEHNHPVVLAHFREAHLDGLATPTDFSPGGFPLYRDGTRHWCDAHPSAVFLD